MIRTVYLMCLQLAIELPGCGHVHWVFCYHYTSQTQLKPAMFLSIRLLVMIYVGNSSYIFQAPSFIATIYNSQLDIQYSSFCKPYQGPRCSYTSCTSVYKCIISQHTTIHIASIQPASQPTYSLFIQQLSEQQQQQLTKQAAIAPSCSYGCGLTSSYCYYYFYLQN